MMDFDTMRGIGGSGMMFFAWVTYLLLNVALVYAILALAKYLRK